MRSIGSRDQGKGIIGFRVEVIGFRVPVSLFRRQRLGFGDVHGEASQISGVPKTARTFANHLSAIYSA